MTEKLYTTTDVGEMLGVHRGTIARWINQGKLKAFTTIGAHRRIRRVDLIAFFAENNISMPAQFSIDEADVQDKG